MRLSLELEDGEVAVPFEHQARLVVRRADPLFREQRFARGEVGEPGVFGLVDGPRHGFFFFKKSWGEAADFFFFF